MLIISLLVIATSLLMPSSASTAIASSDSLSSGISSTIVPSPSTSLIFTTVRTQDSSTVSLSNTQTSSVWSSGIYVNSSTTVSPAGTSSTNLIRPTTSSLGVKASASPGVNPCGKNNGGCAHYCVRYGSNYNCSCAPGFQLESDLRKCRDVDECNSTSGEQKCAHICVNTVGSFACACRTGYKLENDGLACKKVPKTSPTDAAKSDDLEWDWLVLGIVIGAVAFAILCLILGIISKRVTCNQSKENIKTQEMTAVKTASSMAATNLGAIES